jgi:Protein of unknown function (DUF3293)
MADLTVAYRGTSYRVLDGDGRLAAEAWVDRASPSIDALLVAQSAASGVFVTAWNPRSRVQPTAANRQAQERLLRDLDRRGARYLPHVGVGADPAWTEQGAFVLDLEIADAIALATAYGQNAVVAVAMGEPARLLLTGLMPG